MNRSSYDIIGGDDGVRQLVNNFYDYMEVLPEAEAVRNLHPRDLKTAREKLFMFLSGWLGGPDRYIAAFGHPRLRARHLPFKIGPAERDQWMLCMEKSLNDLQIDAAFRMQLLAAFQQTADHMINQQA